MKIVIVGAGAVGDDLARSVSRRESDVVVIELDHDRMLQAKEHLDCRVLEGNGVNPSFLDEVGMADCDLFCAVTDKDEANIIACLTAHHLGASVKVARVRSSEFYRAGNLVFDGIDMAINPDIEAVCSMREILWQQAATDIYEFAGGRVRVVGARVGDRAFVTGKSLAEIEQELGSRWALVITVLRRGETLIPRGDTVIEPDDLVYVAGARGTVDKALTYVTTPSAQLQNVMIVGASPTGLELARELTAHGVNVKLIDRNEARCAHAAEQLHHVLVLHADGTDLELLKSEGVDQMDGFVSVSKDEDTNVMACLLAHYHGPAKTICLVNRPDYVPLLPVLGIDAAISPRLSTSDAIARFVKRGAVVSTHSLGYTGAEILHFHLAAGLGCLDKPLSKLKFPRHAVIGAVLKRGHVVTPRGNTVLRAGDEIVVFALPKGVSEVEKFFTPGK